MQGDLGAMELRRLRRRLALLVVLLLCALLLALGVGVYGTMRTALLTPLKQAVSMRAQAQRSYLAELVGEKSDRSETQDSSAEQEVGGVAITYLSPSLDVLGGSSDPFGKTVPDASAARQALGTGSPVYSTRTFGLQTYLVYTAPVARQGTILGLVQTGISEAQYEEGLRALLLVLAAVGGFGILASAGISAVVVRRALGPIQASMQRQREFVADAAHELRTPLAIIRTAAELSLSGDSSADQPAALEQVLVQGNQLTKLVEDLSLLARADSGALTLRRERLNLVRLIAGTVEDFELLAQEPGITVECHVPRGAVFVVGDEARLRQLLVIVLHNALKHTPAGGTIRVSLELQPSVAVVRVRDSGPGIAPLDMPHIFDRFYRASRERADGDGGGLGLAIGRWIAEAHGGRITASNGEGGGAVFSITLPTAA